MSQEPQIKTPYDEVLSDLNARPHLEGPELAYLIGARDLRNGYIQGWADRDAQDAKYRAAVERLVQAAEQTASRLHQGGMKAPLADDMANYLDEALIELRQS